MINYKIISDNIHYIEPFNVSQLEFDNYLLFFDNLYLEKKNFSVLFDLRKTKIIDCQYCKEQLEYMIKNKNNTEIYLDKTSILVSNHIIKNLLNLLIFSIQKPFKPNLITNKIEEACEFLKN